MDKVTEAGVTILMAIVGVAILAVLVSRQSNTANVLGAFGNMFSGILKTAVSPVAGAGGLSLGGGGITLPSFNWPSTLGVPGFGG